MVKLYICVTAAVSGTEYSGEIAASDLMVTERPRGWSLPCIVLLPLVFIGTPVPLVN